MSFLPFTRPSIDEESIAGVADVLRSGWITTGPKCREFEAALSELFGGRTVRAFNSGTVTMETALRLLDIGPGDEVITTPMSWVATANVILAVGARPVFVDVDPATRNIALDKIEEAMSHRSRAIIPVDLAGLPVRREHLYDIAAEYNVRVVEDAAQAIGASSDGRLIGSFGDYISFSFHANKNLTTTEGGCLVLPEDADAELIARCERLRLQGVQRLADGSMEVMEPGGKANLTDVAARIGLGQLPHLAAFTARRRELARRYFDWFDANGGELLEMGLELPPRDFENSNWHMFQPLLPLDRMSIGRAEFVKRMAEKEIGVGVHYPAMHLFKLYRGLGYEEGDFPHAERVGRETVTLPLFPAMDDGDVERVCSALKDILLQNKK
ncbi:MAG: DegT/DnrJ/EryC1/StrS aminotransferase family protein [Rhodocyclaceae bacterium]|nr:DegT/DnrJ/EryC1/StrS aminotransferase family protein [Rhodocyclaceae bacterium]